MPQCDQRFYLSGTKDFFVTISLTQTNTVMAGCGRVLEGGRWVPVVPNHLSGHGDYFDPTGWIDAIVEIHLHHQAEPLKGLVKKVDSILFGGDERARTIVS